MTKPHGCIHVGRIRTRRNEEQTHMDAIAPAARIGAIQRSRTSTAILMRVPSGTLGTAGRGSNSSTGRGTNSSSHIPQVPSVVTAKPSPQMMHILVSGMGPPSKLNHTSIIFSIFIPLEPFSSTV